MKLHTGEAVTAKDWSLADRQKLGQRLLHDLAEAALGSFVKIASVREELLRSLELDGYEYQGANLLYPEADVLDVGEMSGILQELHRTLGLGEQEAASEFLRLSEEHYLASRWSDSIANGRKFLELTLRQIAVTHSSKFENRELGKGVRDSPQGVRDYLENAGLLERKEKETLAKVYGLLSHTGGHPYMAENDQARLLRHLALVFAHFAMLRLQGKLSAS